MRALQDSLQQALDDWLPFAPCLGVNVSVYDAERGVWHGSSGYSHLHPRKAMKPQQRCYIYSITKSFTATLVLQQIEQGKLALENPVRDYLDCIKPPESMTVRHLLNHSSGLPSYTDWQDYLPALRANPKQAWAFHQVLQRLKRKPLDFEPGQGWHYSNSGYMLLLLLLETVSGQSYGDLLKHSLVRPLKLKQTQLALKAGHKKLTPGYGRLLNSEGLMQNIVPDYDPWWCKTGLITSTSADVLEFYRALFKGDILKPESLKAMCTPLSIQQPAGPPFKDPCYGLGLMIDPQYAHGGLYGHGGDGPGFNSWAQFHPDFKGRHVGIVILCNTARAGHPFDLAQDLLRVLATDK